MPPGEGFMKRYSRSNGDDLLLYICVFVAIVLCGFFPLYYAIHLLGHETSSITRTVQNWSSF